MPQRSPHGTKTFVHFFSVSCANRGLVLGEAVTQTPYSADGVERSITFQRKRLKQDRADALAQLRCIDSSAWSRDEIEAQPDVETQNYARER